MVVLTYEGDVPRVLGEFGFVLGDGVRLCAGAEVAARSLAYEGEVMFSSPVRAVLDTMTGNFGEALLLSERRSHMECKSD